MHPLHPWLRLSCESYLNKCDLRRRLKIGRVCGKVGCQGVYVVPNFRWKVTERLFSKVSRNLRLLQQILVAIASSWMSIKYVDVCRPTWCATWRTSTNFTYKFKLFFGKNILNTVLIFQIIFTKIHSLIWNNFNNRQTNQRPRRTYTVRFLGDLKTNCVANFAITTEITTRSLAIANIPCNCCIIPKSVSIK